jgi:serine protease Do
VKHIWLHHVKRRFALCQIVLMFVAFAIGTFTFLFEITLKKRAAIALQNSSLPNPNQDYQKINNIAKQVTVRLWSTSPIGSGTILKHIDGVYTVLTSAHVLKAGKSPYTVQTPDNKRYLVERILETQYQKDVVLLQFRKLQTNYSVANIGRIDRLVAGEKIYAAGFPLNIRPKIGYQLGNQLTFREGSFVVLLDKPLKDGYRLAYTTPVDLGMSGGGIFNKRGEIIGINGLRDDPIWDIPMKYEDGTEPSSAIQKMIFRASIGIPIQDILYVFSD